MTWSSELDRLTPADGDVFSFRQLEVPDGGPVQDVADVLSAAWAEAEQIRESARAAGFAEGRREGFAAARAEAAPAMAALVSALQEVRGLRAEMTDAIEGDAVRLALGLAEKIVAGAIAVQPERLLDVARLALRHLVDRRHVILLVNPEDLELLAASVGELQQELGGIQHCDVQADRRIERGGVIVRTAAGELDVSIESQFARAAEVVASTLTGTADESLAAAA